MDYEITLEEVNGASFILKPGKSTGIDGISNEIISSLLTKYPDNIIKPFNSIVQSSEFMPEWVLGAMYQYTRRDQKVTHLTIEDSP